MNNSINTIIQGDCLETLKTLPDKSVDCCVTSPPYYMLRDYGDAGQIGLEEMPDLYVAKLLAVFGEARRVLKDEGTLWVNIGDSYNGSGKNKGNTRPLNGKQRADTGSGSGRPLVLSGVRPKQLLGLPWRFALAMQSNWILRQDIIWAKPNPMPESVRDRFCRSHEHVFLFSKQPKYYFNSEAALEPASGYDGRKDAKYKGGVKDMACGAHERCPSRRGYASEEGETGLAPQHHGRNIPTRPMRIKRDVWIVPTEASSERHYAMFPQKLILTCILCGCPEGGVVLDPFMGGGTTAIVAKKHFRNYIGCELNPDYIEIAKRRTADVNPLFEGAFRRE
jgi:DNA modification methylase